MPALQISHLEQALAAKEASAREEGEKNINLTSELHKTIAELSKAHEATQEKLSTTEDELSIARQQSVVQREQVRGRRGGERGWIARSKGTHRACGPWAWASRACCTHRQIDRMEQELRATAIDLAKSADEKLVSLQERYDKQMAELTRQMATLQDEKIKVSAERDRLSKDKEVLEAKANRQAQMSDLMTKKVYEIAEELAHIKKAQGDGKKK